jgi:hypothetical protein
MGVRPVRALLKSLVALPWKAHAAHPLLEVTHLLAGLYERDLRALPTGCPVPLGRVWRKALGGEQCEHALAAAEVTTLLDLRRALRNGTVWVEHSLASRSRETLFIPQRQWEERRRARCAVPCCQEVYQRRRYEPKKAPAAAGMSMPIKYQIARNGAASSGQCSV